MTVFVDTNVFVYARDLSEPDKQKRARAWIDFLWDTGTGRTSVQVMNELYVTLTRKLDPGMPANEARADVIDLMSWRPVDVSAELIAMAWAVEDRFGFSHWDSLVVAAAQSVGASHLLTEDLQDGQDLEGMLVIEPFQHGPNEVELTGR